MYIYITILCARTCWQDKAFDVAFDVRYMFAFHLRKFVFENLPGSTSNLAIANTIWQFTPVTLEIQY